MNPRVDLFVFVKISHMCMRVEHQTGSVYPNSLPASIEGPLLGCLSLQDKQQLAVACHAN